METVTARRAALQRISADVDAMAARFVSYAGDADALARVTAALAAGPADLANGAGAPDSVGMPDSAAAEPVSAGGAGQAGVGEQGSNADGAPGVIGRPGALGADGAVMSALPASTDMLAPAFCAAAGVNGVGRALQSAREMKAVDYVGWPVAWLADR